MSNKRFQNCIDANTQTELAHDGLQVSYKVRLHTKKSKDPLASLRKEEVVYRQARTGQGTSFSSSFLYYCPEKLRTECIHGTFISFLLR